MRKGEGMLLLAASAAVLFLLSHESRASNGIRPTAFGTKSYGRGGADIAWPSSATSMNSNPAAIARLWDEQLEVTPVLFALSSTYRDAENSAQESASKFFPLVNVAYVMDFEQTEEEILDDLRESDPYYRLLDETRRERRGSNGFAPIFGQGKILNVSVPVHPSRFPKEISLVAEGRSAWVFNVSVVANYYAGTDRAYSSILASTVQRAAVSTSRGTVAKFGNLVNLLPDPPDEIAVHFQLEVEFRSREDQAEVRVLFDGSDVGGKRATYAEVQPEPDPGWEEERLPRFEQELTEAKRELSPIKFGIGEFAQAGAGSDYKISTDLYEEGTRHFSNFAFLSLTPTVAFNIADWLSFGATLQLNYASLELITPVTQPVELMQGQLFNGGSLEADLTPVFGIPKQFGPAMKYTLDTSDTHDPGKSITHSNRQGPPAGNDPRFGEITGTADIKDTTSFGFGGKFGLLLPVTDRLTFGITYQTKSAMQNYKGKVRIDYNEQINEYRANPTIGHSNEVVTIFGGGQPTELRFTFDEVWSSGGGGPQQGVVHVFVNGGPHPITPNLPVQSTLSQLPNEGANGFAATYDIEVVDFQLPAEIGFGTAYRLFDWLMVSMDYKRIFWSDSMKNFRTVLKNGSNADVNTLIGSTGMTITLPQNWKDQNVIALGFEYYVNDWLTLRTGWNYGNNPVPPETAMPIVPGITEHHVSLGASVKVGSFSFDGAWMHALATTITTKSSLQTSDLNGSQLTVAQHFLSLGVTYDF